MTINILDKFDDLMGEGKSKRKFKISIDSDILIQKKAMRIPTPKTGGPMKDKKKYNRKQKHKKGYEKDM